MGTRGLARVEEEQVALREAGPGGSPTCVQAMVPVGPWMGVGVWWPRTVPQGRTACVFLAL